MPGSGPEIVTFGCRLNLFESEVMRGHAAAAGLDDAVIVNTCAVTAEAERQARQAIRRLRRERPQARLIVTGCAAQIDPAGFAAMPEIDRVIGNAEKLRAEVWRDTARLRVGDIMAARGTAGRLAGEMDGHSRAFLQIQTGCDHRCTFCVIPFGRGNSRSVPLGEVVAQARALVAAGHREIVLTGVDLTAYGADLPGSPSLGQAVRRLLAQVPELARLRLSSLDPVEVDEDLMRLIGREPRIMPHVHLSLQAGDDLVLKRMKRRHSSADAIALCARLRALRPDIVFGADLIAGFPTETDAMFANTLRLVEACDLTFLHVFPYSARKGTPAARMPQVPGDVRRARADRLRRAGADRLARFLERQVGRDAWVVAERGGTGRTEHYAPVRLAADTPPRALVQVRLQGIENGMLVGRTVREAA